MVLLMRTIKINMVSGCKNESCPYYGDRKCPGDLFKCLEYTS